MKNSKNSKTKVIILTGFLGSGKTTFLNKMISFYKEKGENIAVVENEFGSISIDTDLLLGQGEEIMEVKNGCMCCTVRRDLVRIMRELIEKNKKYDRIIIETSGIANPSPIAQTFLGLEDIYANFELEKIVTVVDSANFEHQIKTEKLVKEQIAFADVLVMTKIDLVTNEVKERVNSIVHSFNTFAPIYEIDTTKLSDNNIFEDLDDIQNTKINTKIRLEDKEEPYKWIGSFDFKAGIYNMSITASGTPHESELFYIQKIDNHDYINSEESKEFLYNKFFELSIDVTDVMEDNILYKKLLEDNKTKTNFEIKEDGIYMLVTQHIPDALEIKNGNNIIQNKVEEISLTTKYAESAKLSSVAFEFKNMDFKPEQVDAFVNYCLDLEGQEILRAKGLFNVADSEKPFYIHVVNTVSESGFLDKKKKDKSTTSQIVFIGYNIDKIKMREAYEELKTFMSA